MESLNSWVLVKFNTRGFGMRELLVSPAGQRCFAFIAVTSSYILPDVGAGWASLSAILGWWQGKVMQQHNTPPIFLLGFKVFALDDSEWKSYNGYSDKKTVHNLLFLWRMVCKNGGFVVASFNNAWLGPRHSLQWCLAKARGSSKTQCKHVVVEELNPWLLVTSQEVLLLHPEQRFQKSWVKMKLVKQLGLCLDCP